MKSINNKKPENIFCFKNQNLPLCVVVTETPWEEVPRFRHQVTRQLLKHYNILYIVLRLNSKTESMNKIFDQLVIYQPCLALKVDIRVYANIPFIHNRVNAAFRNKIIKVIQKFSAQKHILVNFKCDFYELAHSDFFDFKMYICNDEFPGMINKSDKMTLKTIWQQKVFQYYENKTAKAVDYCLAAHYSLLEKLKKYNKNIEFFPAGHEFKQLSRPKIPKTNSPIKIAYMGYLSYYLKLEWIHEILKNKDMRLSLIGPIVKFDAYQFNNYKNIKFIKPLTGNKLYKKLQEMHVLVMPYDASIQHVYIQTVPNKLFQYIAAGRPVVTAALPWLIKLPEGVIYQAKNAVDFVQKIRRAYSEDSKKFIESRLRIASENTWDIRGDRLHHIIMNAIKN